MAKVSLYLDTRTANKNGLYPIKLRITHNNTNASRSLGLYILPNQWDEDYQRLRLKAPNAKLNNERLEDLIYIYRSNIQKLDSMYRLPSMKAADIIEYVENGGFVKSDNLYFNTRIQEYADQCRKETYKKSFLYTEHTVMDFVRTTSPNADKIFLMDINYDFLCRFHSYMEKRGMKKNSMAIVETNIRTIWNRATKSKLLPHDLNPFYGDCGYKIQHELKEKVYLPIDGMRRLLELDFSQVQGGKGLEAARDFFMLSFYLCGINPIDLFYMPKCQSGEMVFVRRKIEHTSPQPVHLFIPAAAQRIIDKYADGPMMLNFDQQYMNFDSCYSFFRHRIDRIAKMIGYPDMTLYWSRYTWSTYAMKMGASDFVVDKLQGRVPTSINGKHYASFEWEDGTNIMDKVIQYATDGVAYNSTPAPKYVK